MGAGPEPSTKHFRSCETREVDTGAHLSDKFRRDRFEALTTPTLLPDWSRGGQRGLEKTLTGWKLKAVEDFREKRGSEEVPQHWMGGGERAAGYFDHNC